MAAVGSDDSSDQERPDEEPEFVAIDVLGNHPRAPLLLRRVEPHGLPPPPQRPQALPVVDDHAIDGPTGPSICCCIIKLVHFLVVVILVAVAGSLMQGDQGSAMAWCLSLIAAVAFSWLMLFYCEPVTDEGQFC